MLHKTVILYDLIEKVERGYFKTIRYPAANSSIFYHLTDHIVYKKEVEAYGSDIIPVNCFIVEGKEQTYYILGKINRSGKEEIHIYHQSGTEFSAVLTEYITGGEYEDDDLLSSLLKALEEKSK